LNTIRPTLLALSFGAAVVLASTAGCPGGAAGHDRGASPRRMPPWSYDEFEVFDDYPGLIAAEPDGDTESVERPPVVSDAAKAWDVRDGVVARDWRYIVIHHSATNEGSAAAFRRYHRRKGWDDLAYHFVIGNGRGAPDGKVELGMRWVRQQAGAHAGNREYNDHGIGICLVGNFERSRPTEAQMASLKKLVRFLRKRFDIGAIDVVRHSDVNTTKCPGRNMPWPVEY